MLPNRADHCIQQTESRCSETNRDSLTPLPLKKHNNSGKKSEPTSKRTRSPGPVRRDTKEVLAELVAKLKEKLDSKKAAATNGEEDERGDVRPQSGPSDGGVDLGDPWSHYAFWVWRETLALYHSAIVFTPTPFFNLLPLGRAFVDERSRSEVLKREAESAHVVKLSHAQFSHS
jgi:hypothetical protein